MLFPALSIPEIQHGLHQVLPSSGLVAVPGFIYVMLGCEILRSLTSAENRMAAGRAADERDPLELANSKGRYVATGVYSCNRVDLLFDA